ncbi:MAG: hypothetical protein K9H58_17620 [Bacteroidales bacterium]|nr:hypothetical protein [Bacteroidales bacterium]
MRNLSLTIAFLMVQFLTWAQDSPHGEEFTIACDVCHTSNSWKIDPAYSTFNHNTSQFQLTGQHTQVVCRSCHTSLIFKDAGTECMACHTDMHEQSLGFECDRCHTPNSWIVPNITEIHQLSRFPLLGAHATADCFECHPSESLLKFEPQGIDCFDCHKDEYYAAINPNHVLGNFSTDCFECHLVNAFTWAGSGFNHYFFPLTQGHEIFECTLCHINGDYSTRPSTDCFDCHQSDYVATSNPNHQSIDFSTNCTECHTTSPGWKPATFDEHDAMFFPVYSGQHNNEWNDCIDCHSNPSNYAVFTCIDCHEHNQSEMDDEHDEIGGYAYNSPACLECHPTGDGEGSFNHSASNFPLTGAHVDTDCASCHTNGYQGTTTICFDCHIEVYNASTNPNHVSAGIHTDCEVCHTTDPGWQPALFEIHDEIYPLTGGHLSTDCFSCHNDNYSNTPNVCFDCHSEQYNQTSNPNHTVVGITTSCDECHTTNPGWTPANFEIHNDFYPLTGAHSSVDCYSCHEGVYSNTPNVCFDCHSEQYNQTSNPNHTIVGITTSCDECHTTNPGWTPALFEIHNDFYPLTGAHSSLDCYSCHEGVYNNTPNTCFGCHASDYNQTNDPPHASAQFPTDCELCHNQSAWEPSTFNHDSQYFPIYSGEHEGEWDQCSDCHTNPSNYEIFNCLVCHEQGDMADEHSGVTGYVYNSIACLECHPDGNNKFNYNSNFNR